MATENEFENIDELIEFILTNIRDRRPAKVTAAQIQEALIGVIGFLNDASGSETIGDLANLTTYYKANIVGAINELDNGLSGISSDQITLSIFKVSNYATL